MAENRIIASQRNAGIDLLRLAAMFMFVVLNCVVSGGLSSFADSSAGSAVFSLIRFAASCAMNCFGLITGYVCVNAKHRPSRLFPLWLSALLYSCGLSVIFVFLRPETVGKSELFRSLFPVLGNNYTYFTSYFCLFFFIPVLNMLIHRLGGRQNSFLVATLLALFSGAAVIGEVTGADFGGGRGFTPLWLGVLYYVGAYLNIYGAKLASKLNGLRCAAGFVVCVAACFGIERLAFGLGEKFPPVLTLTEALTGFSSPILLACAVCLLLLFSRLKIKKGAGAVTRLSSAVFGVYLISGNPLFVKNVIFTEFSALAGEEWWSAAVRLLLGAAAVFALCLAVDLIRALLFKVLRIEKICGKIDSVARNRLPAQPF